MPARLRRARGQRPLQAHRCLTVTPRPQTRAAPFAARQSVLSALTSQVPAKADLKATLSMYKYLDNVSAALAGSYTPGRLQMVLQRAGSRSQAAQNRRGAARVRARLSTPVPVPRARRCGSL